MRILDREEKRNQSPEDLAKAIERVKAEGVQVELHYQIKPFKEWNDRFFRRLFDKVDASPVISRERLKHFFVAEISPAVSNNTVDKITREFEVARRAHDFIEPTVNDPELCADFAFLALENWVE